MAQHRSTNGSGRQQERHACRREHVCQRLLNAADGWQFGVAQHYGVKARVLEIGHWHDGQVAIPDFRVGHHDFRAVWAEHVRQINQTDWSFTFV